MPYRLFVKLVATESLCQQPRTSFEGNQQCTITLFTLLIKTLNSVWVTARQNFFRCYKYCFVCISTVQPMLLKAQSNKKTAFCCWQNEKQNIVKKTTKLFLINDYSSWSRINLKSSHFQWSCITILFLAASPNLLAYSIDIKQPYSVREFWIYAETKLSFGNRKKVFEMRMALSYRYFIKLLLKKLPYKLQKKIFKNKKKH